MLTMFNSRIAVREIKKPNLSESGIFIGEAPEDDGFVKEMVFGEILALGPGELKKNGKREDMGGLKVGDKVAFSPVLMVRQEVDGEEIIITKLNAIAAVIEDEVET